MELVAALVDDAETGMNTGFPGRARGCLGGFALLPADVALREKRLNCLTDVEDAGLALNLPE